LAFIADDAFRNPMSKAITDLIKRFADTAMEDMKDDPIRQRDRAHWIGLGTDVVCSALIRACNMMLDDRMVLGALADGMAPAPTDKVNKLFARHQYAAGASVEQAHADALAEDERRQNGKDGKGSEWSALPEGFGKALLDALLAGPDNADPTMKPIAGNVARAILDVMDREKDGNLEKGGAFAVEIDKATGETRVVGFSSREDALADVAAQLGLDPKDAIAKANAEMDATGIGMAAFITRSDVPAFHDFTRGEVVSDRRKPTEDDDDATSDDHN
jgi:hypothetical protein